jgi:hypothetical protein
MRVRATEVTVGDRIPVIPGRRQLEIVCRVAEVDYTGRVIMIRLQDPLGRQADWQRWPQDLVQALRWRACRAPCCEAHAREIGEDRHYCRVHWEAWQEL